ncbi:MAG: carboxypeptidase-like regulatory domain-containing protein [Bacteroidales bacterium]|nr:carboxypeptidase-like regulatory domain-containing protein [Bacteroidales bacterium]
MKSFKIFLILFLSVAAVQGQNISGTVLEAETNRPLDNVTVYFEKGKIGTVTNEKGEFVLKLPSAMKPTDTLRFSMVGYRTEGMPLSVLQKNNYFVLLAKKTEILSEVQVKANRLQKELPFKKLASLKRGVYHFGSVLIGNQIYVVGGDESSVDKAPKRAMDETSMQANPTLQDFLKKASSNLTFDGFSGKLQIYDIDSNKWVASKLKLQKRAYHQVLFISPSLYILGGKTLSGDRIHEYLDNQIEVLNLKTGQIVVDNINPHQAVNSAAFAYQGNLVVMGGSVKQENDGTKVFTDRSHLYNITTGYWYALLKMNRPKEVCGVLVHNRVYLIGGFANEALKEIESYDFTSGEWHKEGDLFEGMEFPALAGKGNMIYIFQQGKLLTYDVKTRKLTEYKIDLELKGARMHCYQNKLYIVGGSEAGMYTKTASTGVYSVDLDAFANTRVVRMKWME